MRDRDDGNPWLAVRGVEHPPEIEGVPGCPKLEPWCGQHAVEVQRQFLAIARGVERLEIEDSKAIERWTLDLLDQPRKVGGPIGRRLRQDRGQERLVAVVARRIDSSERQEPYRDVHGPGVGGLALLAWRGPQRFQDGERRASPAAGGIDADAGGAL